MVVTGFIALGIAIFVILASVDLLQQGLYDTEYQQTFLGADGCSEEVLLRLNSDDSYTGGAFTIGSTSCTATVTDAGGGIRTVRVVSTKGTVYISTLELTVDTNVSPIVVTNFEEVL